MNKYLTYLAILALIPLFTAGLTTDYFTDANALKSKGVATSKYGSATNVCGDRLCSEIPGGKTAWTNKSPSQHVTVPKVTSSAETFGTTSMTEKDLGSVLRLSRANVPAEIPMHKGFYNGGDVYFIITDSSDPKHAEIITKNQGWKVELAPLLAKAPSSALSKTYMFTNGINGDGVHGFQGEVFTSTPAQPDIYSALTSHVHVTWIDEKQSRVLDSETKILDAAQGGEVSLAEIPVVLNMPQIVWPDGQMIVKEDKTLTDDLPYGGGQVLDIDTEKKTVTFIAHRGWGPDGRTIYYIVTDATPIGPANMMGVINTPTSASLITNAAAVDLYQFKNGLKGSGPMGFQAGIAAGAPGDENYSPMWRIFMTGWNDPSSAKLLENIDDLNAYRQAGLIDIGIARPMDSDHIVNCPFIDPFQ
ncbi:MAG: hypothetical protein OEL69_06750 [Nitrosopumilus sp.]|jgi:hypothetical protein|nr:hypothetical protein [Nitrosopumilus sp.]